MRTRVLLFASLVATWSSPVLAAAGPSLSDTWLGIPRWVWLTVNLFIFWGLIFRFAGPPIKRYLDQRAETIASDLAEARRQRAEVVQLHDSLDAKIEEIRGEMEEMVRRSEEAAERDREEILAQAERDRERLLQQTRDEVEHRVTQARHELRREAAALATRLAAERIEREIGDGDRRRLFDVSLQKLEGESN